MKFFKLLLGTWLLGLLVACGGGGGSPGENPNQSTLVTTAGASQTLLPGVAGAFGISGGVPPYRAQSSDAAIVVAGVNGSSLNIGAVKPGSATVTVLDNSGARVAVNVAVGSSTPLGTTAPNSVVLAVGASAAQTFDIIGGVSPFSVTSSNANVVQVSQAGSKFVLTGAALGTASIGITDAAGKTISVDAKVEALVPLFTTAQSTISISPGSAATRNFNVGGGVSPYTVSSSNDGVVGANVTGSNLAITGRQIGSGTLLIRDAAGATVLINVTVAPVVPLFTTATSTVSIVAGGSVSYTVGGGTAPYSVASSSVSVANATVTAGALTIGAVAQGTATLTVRDSANSTVQIEVVVTQRPALFTTAGGPVTLSPGPLAARTFTIGGGLPGYTATTANESVVTAMTNGTSLVLTGSGLGSTTVVVRDSAGQTLAIAVTVASVSPLSTTAPASLSVSIGSAPTFTIAGGVAPYDVTSSNESVALIAQSGSTWSVQGLRTGSATVTVRDASGGNPLIVSVTVAPERPFFTDTPTNLTLVLDSGASRTFVLGGGVAPYFATSSNAAVVSAAIGGGGSTVNVTGEAVGTATLQLRDSASGLFTVTVTVTTSSVSAPVSLFSTAPSPVAVSVGAASQSFLIGGGVPPYNVVSDNIGIATVDTTSLPNFSITGVAQGLANIRITDAVGSPLGIGVNVTASSTVVPDLVLLPNTGTGNVGDTLVFIIGGGEAPYQAVANNPAVVALAGPITGNALNLRLLNSGIGVITVSDSAGRTIELSVTVEPTTPSLRLSPSVLSLAEIETGDALSFPLSIYGGVTPYRTFSSDTTLLQVPGGTSNSPSVTVTQQVKGVVDDTVVTITVIDATGASATSAVTIKNNP